MKTMILTGSVALGLLALAGCGPKPAEPAATTETTTVTTETTAAPDAMAPATDAAAPVADAAAPAADATTAVAGDDQHTPVVPGAAAATEK